MAANQSQRPKFYEEQYLGAADLTAAVDYGRVQQARHTLGAHTWGIAIGLQLKETPQADGAVSVHLLPGYAWDGYGHPIVVLSPYKIPEEKFSAITFDPALDTDGKGRLIPVWLRYDESATQNPRPGFEVCGTADQYSRIQETFRIEIGQRGTTDRYAGVTVAAKSLKDAKTALQAFDPTAPLVYDESIPQQTFPEPQDRARWLIPIGYVRWLPVLNPPGHFVARDDSGVGGAEKDFDKIRRFRRYIGVVAEEIEAADGVIRLRDRGRAPANSFFQAPTKKQPTDTTYDPTNDLVWVEGNLRVLGNAKLCNGKLDFRDLQGKDSNIPLTIQRKEDADTGAHALQIAIGPDTQNNHRFAVGPLNGVGPGNEHVVERFVVLSGGNVGIGTSAPKLNLEIRGTDVVDFGRNDGPATLHLFGARIGDTGGARLFLRAFAGGVVAFDGTNNKIGIGTDAPDRPLTIQGEAGTYLNVKADGGSHEVLLGADSAGGIISTMTNHDLQLRAGGNATKMVVKADGKIGIGTTTPDQALTIQGNPGTYLNVKGNNGAHEVLLGADVNGGIVSTITNHDLQLRAGLNITRMVVKVDGKIGIGTTTPDQALTIQGNPGTYLNVKGNNGAHEVLLGADVNGGIVSTITNHDLQLRAGLNITRMVVKADGKVGIGTTTPDSLLHVNGVASKPGGGPWSSSSDARLKNDIRPLTNALDKLLQLRGVGFEWKEPEQMGNLTGRQMGLVAQDVEMVFPEWISTSPNGYKQLTIRGFEALTVEALRELKAEIDSLKARRPQQRS